MAFSKLILFPITALKDNDYPTYGEPIKLYSGNGINNVDVSLKAEKTTNEKKADNVVEKKTKTTGYTMDVSVYDVDRVGYEKIFGYKKDGNNNLILIEDNENLGYGVFFETVEGASKVQIYLNRATIADITESIKTDDGGAQEVKKVSFNGVIPIIEGLPNKGAKVYEGETGFVVGFPTTMYKEVKEVK